VSVRFHMKAFTRIAVLMAAVLSQQALACKLEAGIEYKKPTESERFAEADLVFSGSVVAMKEAPKVDGVTQPPYTYLYTLKVDKWLKGSGNRTIQVIDGGGTNCDPAFGVSHIEVESSALPSHGWLVFARVSKGRAWVITVSNKK